jgi:hypothetical protein
MIVAVVCVVCYSFFFGLHGLLFFVFLFVHLHISDMDRSGRAQPMPEERSSPVKVSKCYLILFTYL